MDPASTPRVIASLWFSLDGHCLHNICVQCALPYYTLHFTFFLCPCVLQMKSCRFFTVFFHRELQELLSYSFGFLFFQPEFLPWAIKKKKDLPPVQTHAHPISHSCASKSVGINITDWSLMNRSTGIPLKCPGSLQTQGNISWPLNILHRTFTISQYSIAFNHILGHNTSHALWSLFLLWWSHITSLWLPLSWDNTLLHLWIKLSPSRLHWVWLPVQFWVILQSQQIPHGTARSYPFCLRCIYKVIGF